ncbi:hypothetical protein SAMN05444141_107242 [Pseudovibrio denitrificans]|uniref:Uncharacterized protein n=1 Tax=Pseudovibrio denitrificans TaxID=258256 RepID=A0A1I7D364_9HYPH|nr:hypothetical protein SAMN05444141_107242 [Pseudovibrio denitrificans]
MKLNSIEKFEEGRKKYGRWLGYAPLSTYHSYANYRWNNKTILNLLILSILLIVLPSIFSVHLMKYETIQYLVSFCLKTFPMFQSRFFALQRLSSYSASHFAIASISTLLLTISFTLILVFGYLKHWNENKAYHRVSHLQFLGAIVFFLAALLAIWGIFIFTPEDINPGRLGTFVMFVAPFFSFYCVAFVLFVPGLLAQPIVFMIKLVHQLTFGFYEERH